MEIRNGRRQHTAHPCPRKQCMGRVSDSSAIGTDHRTDDILTVFAMPLEMKLHAASHSRRAEGGSHRLCATGIVPKGVDSFYCSAGLLSVLWFARTHLFLARGFYELFWICKLKRSFLFWPLPRLRSDALIVVGVSPSLTTENGRRTCPSFPPLQCRRSSTLTRCYEPLCVACSKHHTRNCVQKSNKSLFCKITPRPTARRPDLARAERPSVMSPCCWQDAASIAFDSKRLTTTAT